MKRGVGLEISSDNTPNINNAELIGVWIVANYVTANASRLKNIRTSWTKEEVISLLSILGGRLYVKLGTVFYKMALKQFLAGKTTS